ncbi:MAG TPA: 50S ribosomal protein L30 [Cryomorphaceae bacterium]|nr:50S ribosomal protein L30 [Cryomorphaceae bacterium]
MAKELVVTQVKSAIRRPKNQKRTLEALGLKKLNRPVTKTGTPQIMGMIAKVSHLVIVQEK